MFDKHSLFDWVFWIGIVLCAVFGVIFAINDYHGKTNMSAMNIVGVTSEIRLYSYEDCSVQADTLFTGEHVVITKGNSTENFIVSEIRSVQIKDMTLDATGSNLVAKIGDEWFLILLTTA